VEADDPLALRREYAYYDPIHTLPADGQRWWADRERGRSPAPLGTSLTPAAR
jgi:lysine 2,3-aminomutase